MKRCKAITTKGTRCKIQVERETGFCHFHDRYTSEERRDETPEERLEEKFEPCEVEPVAPSEARQEPLTEMKEPETTQSPQTSEEYLIPSILIGAMVIFLVIVGLSFFI